MQTGEKSQKLVHFMIETRIHSALIYSQIQLHDVTVEYN